MNTYIAIFIAALCSALFLTPLTRDLSIKFGWLDEPGDDRRVHHKAIPRLGGIAILVSVLIGVDPLSG